MNRDVVMVSWDGDAEVMVYEYRAVEGSTLVKSMARSQAPPSRSLPFFRSPSACSSGSPLGLKPCRSSSTATTHHASLSALLAHTCAGGGWGDSGTGSIE